MEFRRVLFRSDRKSTRLNSSHLVISYAVFCLIIQTDRKSTRLNSSHLLISYAVFCLKKNRASVHHPAAARHALWHSVFNSPANGQWRRASDRTPGGGYAGVIRYWLLIFFFNDTATTEIYTLSLHDALPI